VAPVSQFRTTENTAFEKLLYLHWFKITGVPHVIGRSLCIIPYTLWPAAILLVQ